MKYKYLFISVLLMAIISMSATCQDDIEDQDLVDKRENIEGKWHGSYNDGAPVDYEIEITLDAEDETKINLKNFFRGDETAYAIMTENTLTIPSQSYGSETIEGTGIIQNDYQRIEWQLIVDDEEFAVTYTPGGVTKKVEN